MRDRADKGRKWTRRKRRRRRRRRRRRGRRVEDKKGDNGREEEDGYEGGWRFLNMPLWSMKKRKSEIGRERERERESVIEMGAE